MIDVQIVDTKPVLVIVSAHASLTSAGVQSVTGVYVNNTDPKNPVVNVQPLEDRVEDIEAILQSQSNFTGYAFAVWSGTGLIFDVFWPPYYIQGTRYEGGSGQVTLNPADPTFPRLDVIAVDATGPIKLTGVASVDPVKPTVDPLTQLEITTVLVAAGATTPTQISNEIIYSENAEWTPATNNGTVTFNDNTNPFSGTVAINSGLFNNTHYIRFTDGSTHSKSDFSVVKFALYLKSLWVGGTSPTYLKLTFYNGTTPVSSTVPVVSGKYNFLRTLEEEYQTIVVPIAEFTFTNPLFDRLEITFEGTNPDGFFLDELVLQTGAATISPLQNALVTVQTDAGLANADTPDDTFQMVGADGTLITASGKVITVRGLPLVTAAGTDTYTGTLTGFTAGSGKMIQVKIPNNNTGAATFNLNGSGNKPIKKTGGTEDVSANDLKANGVYVFHDDGTNWQVIGVGVGGHVIKEGGTPLTQRAGLNFDSNDFNLSDDAGNDETHVAINDSKFATRTYAESLVTGLWDDRGNFDASVNAYPSSGGSGTAGAILKGDIWTISVAGTLPTGQVVEPGDTVRALVDTPGNTQANWAIAQNNIGYTPVAGPATSVNNNVVFFDGTTGKLIKDSGLTLAGLNTGDVTLAGTPNYITISGQVITRSLVDLASHVTGDLPFANIVQIATASFLGRNTAATGDIEVLSIPTAKAMLNLSGTNSGDQTSIVGITGTKAQFNTALTDGDFMYVGDAPTAHTHVLSNITDITATAAEVNLLDLTALTAGWVLIATGTTTAAWGQLATSQLNNDAGFLTANQTITLSGEVTGSGTTAITTTINAAINKTWTGTHVFTANQVIVSLEDAGTNTILYPLKVRRTTSGLAAIGIGVGVEFEVETADGANDIGARISAAATDVTAASEDFDLYFDTQVAGALRRSMQLSNLNLSFWNAAGTFRSTLSFTSPTANRVFTFPNVASDTVTLIAAPQTLTNKTITTILGVAGTANALWAATTTGNTTILSGQTSGTLVVGGTSSTGVITIGQSTAAQTLNLAIGATAADTTKTINIGTAGVSTSITNINIGSAVSGAVGTTIIGGATFRLLNTPATDVEFSTSQVLVRDSAGNVDVIAASGGGTTNFLRADGTWAVPSGVVSSVGTNDLNKSNGSGGFVVSEVMSNSLGSLTLGATTTGGTQRSITAEGSGTNISLALSGKGSSGVLLSSLTGNIFSVDPATINAQYDNLSRFTINSNDNRLLNWSATTNSIIYALRLIGQSTGTPAIGTGTGISFSTLTGTNNVEIGAEIISISTDVTAASEDFDLVFKVMADGAASDEKMRIASTGMVTMKKFVRAYSGGSVGWVGMATGTSLASGYVEWYRADSTTRIAYLGWNDGGANNLGLNLENSAHFNINGGNVGIGIGANAPQGGLEILKSNAALVLRSSGATEYTSLRFYNDQNLNTRSLEVGYSGSSFATAVVSGGVTGESAYLSATGAYPIQFATNNTFRMIINSSGNIGIGNTNPTEKLYVTGNIYATGTITELSDVRLKNNIKPYTGGLDEVLRMAPVTYFKEERHEIGLIAQDVYAIEPLLVNTTNEFYSMSYNKITLLLINAIKELKRENDNLRLGLLQLKN